ncbi:hypothetical protein [Rhodopila sp.]|uniref:hypothetical protein n=1 Tax=Rhodopila sp. TaxID=2480087 RepID=UPI003D153213
MANKAPLRGSVKIQEAKREVQVDPEQTEGPGTNSEAFPLFVCVRCRTGAFYADVCTPAIQVWAMEATEQ